MAGRTGSKNPKPYSRRGAAAPLKADTGKTLEKSREDLEREVRRQTLELNAANRRLVRQAQKWKMMEEAIRESETRYRTLVESMVDGVFVVQDETIRYANPFMADALGYPTEELPGKELSAIIAPEDRERAHEKYEDLLSGKDVSIPYELRALHKDGRTRIFVRVALALIEYEGGRAILGTARDITGQKRAEASLRESEEKFRRITENMRDVVCQLDDMGRICYASPSYGKVLGYDPAELIGQSPFQRFHPEDVATVLAAFGAALKDGEPVNVSLRYRHALGHYVWLQSSGSFLSDETGKITGAVISSRDITQQKRFEEALLEKQKHINLTLEGTDEGLWEYEVETRRLRFNEHSDSEREMSFDRWLSTLHPASVAVYTEAIRQYYQKQKKYYEVELQIRRESGEWKWIWTRGILVNDSNGQPVKMIGAYRDISERKMAEKALRESEERFRSVAESTSDWIWEVDADGRYTFAGSKIESLLGYRPEEVIGRKPFEFMPQQEAERVEPIFHEIMAAKKPFSFLENINLHKDGRTLVLETSGVPVLDVSGNLLGYRGIDHDITQKKALEAQAIRARHLASIGELAAGVAHEINNPVTGIINYAQILADEAAEAGGDAEIPGRIIKEGERIAKIVKNLLFFARESNTDKQPVAILPLLEDSVALVAALLRKEGIAVTMNISEGVPMIVGNRKDLQHVFLNLLANSRYALNRKHSGFEKEKVIEIAASEKAVHGIPKVRVSFLDKGNGISPEVIGRIFDPFFSTKPPNQAMGLGLSISYGIIKDHKGSIDVESKEGEYTKVILDFPSVA